MLTMTLPIDSDSAEVYESEGSALQSAGPGTIAAVLRVRAGFAIAIAVLLLTGIASCGDGDESVSEEELERALREAEREAQEDLVNLAGTVEILREEVEDLEKQSGSDGGATPDISGPAPPPVSDFPDAVECAGDIYAREGTTSCAFALNVAGDYFSSPSNTFESFSPTTGETYTMTCSGSAPVICTGGNNAIVYIP